VSRVRRRWIRGAVTASALVLLASSSSALAAGRAVLDRHIGCASINHPEVAGDCATTTIAAYRGWSAWSRADPVTGQFRLVVRHPGGAITTPPVGERAAPFDVQLGPSGGGVAAVYSRCADPIRLTGCSIRLIRLGVDGAHERTIAVPGGGSVHTPAIWDRQLAFLRRNVSGGGEDAGIPGRDPDRLFEWTIGGGAPAVLPFPKRFGSPGLISGLALRGTEVAFTTEPPAVISVLGLWTQTPGARPREIDNQTSGQGDICTSIFLSPTFVGPHTLDALLRGCQQDLGDRLTRYDLATGAAQQAEVRLGSDENDDVTAAVAVGGAAEWINDSDLFRQTGVRYRRIALEQLPQGCSPTSC